LLIEEYDALIIRKHERTRRDKKNDSHATHSGAARPDGPVFMTYRAQEKIDSLVAEALQNNPPLYDFVANDIFAYDLRVPTYDPLVTAFAEVPFLYIAMGIIVRPAPVRVRGFERDGL